MKIVNKIAGVTLATLVWPSAFGQVVDGNSFEDPLVLIEIVSVQPLDISSDDRFVVSSKEIVHDAVGKIVEVFDGTDDLVGRTFPLASPIYTNIYRHPESLTPNVLEFEGFADKELLPVGARMILPVVRIKDYDYARYNYFGFPDRSVFFTLFGTGFQLDMVTPDRFETRLEWAEAIREFNAIDDEDERIVYLKQAVLSENPLLAVTAVHLFKRFYPWQAEKHFEEVILASGISVYARLAMDHEFCLSRGKAWVDGGQKKLEQILKDETLEVPDGAGLLSFREQMIGNGSWFGGRGERE